MALESTGHSRGNPRIYELIEGAPKTGKSPTIWAWPEVIDWFKIAGQPVPGPWPPHQQPRPDPEQESLPEAVRERPRTAPPAAPRPAPSNSTSGPAKPTYGVMDEPPSETPRSGLGYLD